jgi:hypothetical protein
MSARTPPLARGDRPAGRAEDPTTHGTTTVEKVLVAALAAMVAYVGWRDPSERGD